MRSRIAPALLIAALAVTGVGLLLAPAAATPAENLKVLPKGMDKKDVKPIMKGWAKALGVECEHCHSDDGMAIDTEKKEKARTMYKMVQAINARYMKKLKAEVTCKTCHRGDVKPKQ